METKFVMDLVIEQIRNGMILRKPIIYLQTTELEIVRRVLNSDRVVVRMARRAADTMIPFAAAYADYSSGYYGDLIDYRIINMDCCSCEELPKKINGGCEDDGCYGRLVLKGDKKIKSNYFLPSLLAVHIRKNAMPYNNASVFDALYPFIDRYLQEEDDSGAIRSSVVLLHGEQMELPAWLMPYCYIVEEPYPEREEIATIINRKVEQSSCGKLPEDSIESYVSGFLGNTLVQVENTVDYLLNLPEDPFTKSPTIKNESKVQKVLATLKEQNVKRIGLLEVQRIDEKEELGGMEIFRQWLDNSKKSIPRADYIFRRTGAAGHKGILMCGIPGCGKSAAVNLLAKELRLPVLKMDIGRLMGGIVGESEHNMHLALRLAEAMAPCILYIDEIEKGFGGSGKSEDASGVTKRMFGILLSWMQDCTKPVYIFATANSLAGIPKEFFRSGRFDSHFALYMPTHAECIDIFKKRMQKAAETVFEYDKNGELFYSQCYDDSNLSSVINHLLFEENGQKRGRFITGADIAKLVNMALRQFADRRRAINHVEWIAALKNAVNETTVYGDGNENLDSIAVCYLRMLRLGFKPASSGCLFSPEDYSVIYKEDGIKPSVAEKEVFETEYDRVLYHIIREKMIFLAARMEENAISDLVR